MADHPQTHLNYLNQCIFNLQKLGLELKCSLCLKVYNRPVLFPCDHIFCSSCIPKSILFGLNCPICKAPYVDEDLRHVPFMEHVVNAYKSLDASFSMHMLNSGNSTSGTRGTVGQYEAVDVDMNQMESSPESPPSSGDSKGVDVDSHGPGSVYDTAGICPSKKSAKRTADDIGARSLDRRCKKQKSLNRGQPKLCRSITPVAAMDLQNSSCTGLGITNTGNNCGNQHIAEPDSASLLSVICAFCQTWKIKEGSGPMQHFADGRQVFGSEAGRSNVVHVHQSCIEWAPQIYYENDTLKNLDKELARAGKLKCASCGIKGAALGCIVKSCRRSYHIPCAYDIDECRWDTDNYLMLCPVHASYKFPNEKSKKASLKKCVSAQRNKFVPPVTHDEQKTLRDFDFWATSPTGAKKWVICGSALSADEKYKLVKFANLCGATVVKNWNPNVTHVIAATDANGACDRTLKVLMAIVNGRWILKTEWIEACLQSKSPIDEEPYEISRDNHGCFDGPKRGRLRLMNNEPKLFNSMKFFFDGEFVEAYKNDLQNLVKAAGGTILIKSEELQNSSEEQCHPSTTVVVYNNDSREVSKVLKRQVEAEKLASESGSQVIAHTWILDSVASGVVKPFVQRLRNVESPGV